MKQLNSVYPVICASQGASLAEFFCNELGYQRVFDSDWYWHLNLAGKPEVNVAIVDCDHSSIPESYRKPVQGLLLNFEMENVTDFYHHAKTREWPVLLELKDEEWGQRHFIIATPEPGLMLDLIEEIPPSEAFLKHYKNEAEPA